MFSLPKFTLSLSLLLILSACNQADQTPEFTKNVVTTSVTQGNIQNNFNLTGTLEAVQSAYVSAKSPGRITELYKDTGDQVFVNELIGRLGGEENKVELNAAQIAVKNLEESLANTKNLTQKQIENAQKELTTAENNLKLLTLSEENINSTSLANQKSAELGVEQAKINLESSQTMLKDIQSQLAQESLNLSDNAKTAITQALILANMSETFLDDLLGVSELKKTNNDSFETSLGALNRSTFTTAQNSLRISLQLNQELQNQYDNKINLQNPTEEDLLAGLKIAEKTLEQSKKALEDTYVVLSNTTTNNSLPATTLNSYKEQVVSLGSQIENATLSVTGSFVVGVKGILQGSENLKVQSSLTLNQANNNLSQAKKMHEIAQQELEKLKANIKMQKDDIRLKKEIAANQVEQAELGVETAKANQKSQTQLIETQLDQTRSQLNLASVSLENTEIRAPFSGVITEKLIEVGTVINSGTPLFKIETTDALKINAEIAEQDLDFISLGQTAYLNNALNPQETFTGEIIKINPSANPISHKIGIEIVVNNLPSNIKLGSTFTIILTKETKEKAFIIPFDSVIYQYNQTFVFRVKENLAEKVLVKTGIISDQSIEILEGLELNDQIVIKGQHNLRAGDQVKVIQAE